MTLFLWLDLFIDRFLHFLSVGRRDLADLPR